MAQAVKKEQRYSVADYQKWPDEERWELIDGVAYDMSPTPKIKHQNIVSNFHKFDFSIVSACLLKERYI